jgi:metal-sulfur cluster biosynthetic enzyme
MTDRTVEEIASDAADTAGPDDATSDSHRADLVDAASASVLAGSDDAVSASAGSDDAVSAGAGDAVEGGSPVVSKATIADIEEAMKDVVDPELGINVVDLGLVYGTFVDDENVVTLDMTLTSAACPLTDVIEDQTRQALTAGPGGGLCNDFRINWVWLPPWGPDKITDEGRDQLRALGFNV